MVSTREDHELDVRPGDQRPRLLVLSSTYPRWKDDVGPVFVHELCKRLTKWFNVRVVCPHAPGALAKETMEGVEVRRFRYAPERLQLLTANGGIPANLKRSLWKWLLLPGFMVCLTLSVHKHIRHWRPNISHAHWLIPQALVLVFLAKIGGRGCPILATSHGSDLYGFRFWPMKAVKRFVIENCDAVAVVSTAMVAEVRRIGISSDHLAVEPMGVDLKSKFTPDSSIARSSDEILFIGRLTKIKGVDVLIDALPKIIQSNPRAFLTIVGSGPEQNRLRKQVEDLGLRKKVVFLGALSQRSLPDLYRRAAVFVAPSIKTSDGQQEGLGLVVIEAIGCACPVIASNYPAVHDLLREERCLFSPGSSAQLAKAVESLLAMPCEERIELARRQMRFLEGKFDWSARSCSYGRLIASLREKAG